MSERRVWTYLKALQALEEIRKLPAEEQQTRRVEAIDAFRYLWSVGFTEGVFARATRRLVLFPEILFIMTTETMGAREGL